MNASKLLFVDTGAWIALALDRDPHHEQAIAVWEHMLSRGARLYTSVPVVIETFTFLDRNVSRDVAKSWNAALDTVGRLSLLECRKSDLKNAWSYFERKDLHKLSVVDATSFVLMKREKIRMAFTFDHHFASAGFQIAG